MTDDKAKRLTLSDGTHIAYHQTPGATPGVIFLGGFMSDMTGTKATALEAHCRATGRAFVRFDYLGHGASAGKFEEGTIGRWRDDALAILDQVAEGPQILVGSSMGGWIALLVALARPARVAGLVGVAAAPDFTRDLMWPSFTPDERAALERDGFIRQPTEYGDEPYVITRKLLDEAQDHLLLDGPVAVTCPVRLIHGTADPDVPYDVSRRLLERLTAQDVTLTLVKDGDHRMSSPADLARLCAAVDELAEA